MWYPLELDTTYKMMDANEQKEFEMDAIEQQDLIAANENVVFNQEDDEDFEDMDYAMDHDDLGVIALLELRNGPVHV